MKSSSLRHPENNRYIHVCEWQIKFCQGNHCAALLLSFFSGWHDWKLKNDYYYHKANDIAEKHGDGRPNNEYAYLFFSTEELIEGTLGFYGKNAINGALELLTNLHVLSIHKNPNPRYHFDKTRYFQFQPGICNKWIAENYSLSEERRHTNTQVHDYEDHPKQDDRSAKSENFDRLKRDDRCTEIGSRSFENQRPSSETGQYIRTNITNNTTNKYQSIQLDENDVFDKNKNDIIAALIAKGFPPAKIYPDSQAAINKLQQAGATVEIFDKAYEISIESTKDKGFGVNYLVKVVQSLLAQQNKGVDKHKSKSDPTYSNDFRNGADWLDDIVEGV